MATDDKTDDLFIVIEQLQGSSGGGASTLRSRLTWPFSEAGPDRDMGHMLPSPMLLVTHWDGRSAVKYRVAHVSKHHVII
jgi:hypothetical protein